MGVVDVKVVPFGELLLEQGITHIDALFLDMEGNELAALQSIDWARISVTALCIEDNEGESGNNQVRMLLEGQGYSLATSIAQDDIYVKRSVKLSP